LEEIVEGLALASVPEHVPPHLVRDINPWVDLTAAGINAFARAATYHQLFPPIFWAKNLGYLEGCWVTRRAADMRKMLKDTDTFSSDGVVGFSRLIGEDWRLIPIEVDPPLHSQYRRLLAPLFTPKKAAAMTADMQALAAELLAKFAARGECDFNEDFATRFPILIFLGLMGYPSEDAATFARWSRTLIKSSDPVVAGMACKEIVGYFHARIAERRLNPGDDFTSFVLASEIDGRKLNPEEVLGMCVLIFLAGLDTVSSALGFQFLHLARHPEHQAQLRANPDLIPAAVEELLRSYSIVNSRRRVTKDTQFGDIFFRQGDYVMISPELANIDPEEVERPLEVDFERQDRGHLSFSSGPHRCLGSHLARRELAVALEQWLKVIPPFRLKDEEQIEVRAAAVFGVENLRLQW
jgi:cytochrome P450